MTQWMIVEYRIPRGVITGIGIYRVKGCCSCLCLRVGMRWWWLILRTSPPPSRWEPALGSSMGPVGARIPQPIPQAVELMLVPNIGPGVKIVLRRRRWEPLGSRGPWRSTVTHHTRLTYQGRTHLHTGSCGGRRCSCCPLVLVIEA